VTAPVASVTVEGGDTFRRTTREASADLADMAPRPAGEYVRDQARAAAPFVSGRLRTSLHVETGAGLVTVGSDLIYAPVIHNGWAAHNIRANPFLIPVAEATENVWGRSYQVETTHIVGKVQGA
jgi:phage gpG-like protein